MGQNRQVVVLDLLLWRVARERALLRENRIDALVTKNSGGSMTRAKIDAATDLGIDILMIARPSAPDVPSVGTVDDAVAWVRSR